MCPQQFVEQKSRFEVRTGGRVLDPAYAVAQVQPFGALIKGAQQSLQSPSQVGCLADVGIGALIGAAQRKDSWGCGSGQKISLRVARDEL